MAQRNEKGQFAAGNKASPGRKPRPAEVNFLNILKECITADDWRKVVNTAVSLAMAGDAKAREWIGNYLIGKPPQILELKAVEAAQLAEVLKLLESRDIPASSVFEAMLLELQEADTQAGYDE